MAAIIVRVTTPRPIYVSWLDSVRHEDGWDTVKAYVEVATKRTLLHKTLAFLVSEDEHAIVVSAHVSADHEADEHQVCSVMQIPKAAILDRMWVDLPVLPKLTAMMEGVEG